MDPDRRTARAAGLLYLLTFAASFPALALLGPVLEPGYVLGPGQDVRVTTGALLDLVNAGAAIGTAVVLLPVMRRYGEALALGFVAARTMEAAIIAIGVVDVLAVVTMRGEVAPGADATALTTTASALVTARDWTFLLGPGLVPGINALLLGILMYRSGLVPRAIPVIGLVGAPLHLLSVLATAYGLNTQLSVVSAVAVLPIVAWELSLGLWLTFRGFRPVVPDPVRTALAGVKDA